MKASLFPRWFRYLLAGSFGTFLLLALFARDGRVGVGAYAVFESLVSSAAPVLDTHAMLGASQRMPGKGAYRLNGMRVQFDTFGTPQGAGRALIEIEQAMEEAGYVHRILPIHGLPMTVGIHPETRVMLTAMPGRDLEGQPVVRLTQQNLAELEEGFRAEIPGIPLYPGAQGQTLIEALDGEPSTSLTYTAGGLPEDVRAYYLAEMPRRGWRWIQDPLGSRGLPVEVVFFEKDGIECSVVVSELPGTAQSLVLTSVSGAQPEV